MSRESRLLRFDVDETAYLQQEENGSITLRDSDGLLIRYVGATLEVELAKLLLARSETATTASSVALYHVINGWPEPHKEKDCPHCKWPAGYPKVEKTEFGTYYVTVRPHTDEAVEKVTNIECAVTLDHGSKGLFLGFEVFDIPEEK